MLKAARVAARDVWGRRARVWRPPLSRTSRVAAPAGGAGMRGGGSASLPSQPTPAPLGLCCLIGGWCDEDPPRRSAKSHALRTAAPCAGLVGHSSPAQHGEGEQQSCGHGEEGRRPRHRTQRYRRGPTPDHSHSRGQSSWARCREAHASIELQGAGQRMDDHLSRCALPLSSAASSAPMRPSRAQPVRAAACSLGPRESGGRGDV